MESERGIKGEAVDGQRCLMISESLLAVMTSSDSRRRSRQRGKKSQEEAKRGGAIKQGPSPDRVLDGLQDSLLEQRTRSIEIEDACPKSY